MRYVESQDMRYVVDRLYDGQLVPSISIPWVIHDPQQDMNYLVYVGYTVASPRKKRKLISSLGGIKKEVDRICVAIYPRAIYEIKDPSDWQNAHPDNKIPVIKD